MRKDLVDAVLNSPAKVVCIHAGAGHGKTTVLSQVANSAEKVVWLLRQGSDIVKFVERPQSIACKIDLICPAGSAPGFAFPIPADAAGARWVLVDIVNYDGKKGVDNTNKGGVYEASATASPGSYSYTWKYLGKGDTYYGPDLLAGENSTSQCTFSTPQPPFREGRL